MVIVTADHGEALHEHGHVGHNQQVYEESVHVPLIVRLPKGLGPRGVRRQALTSHLDLAPTVADLLGVLGKGGSGRAFRGRSLLPALFADPPPSAVASRTTGDRPVYGLRAGPHKYIFDRTAGREELYDLEHDPGEQRDLAPGSPLLTAVYRQMLGQWLADLRRESRFEARPAQIDERRRGVAPRPGLRAVIGVSGFRSWRHRGLVLALLLSAAAVAIHDQTRYVAYTRYDLPDFDPWVYMAMAEHPSVFTLTPWGHRTLKPWLLHALAESNRELRTDRYVNAVGLTIAGPLLFLFLRRLGHGEGASLLALVVFLFTEPFAVLFEEPLLTDPLSVPLTVGLLLAIEAGAGAAILALLFALGTHSKELFVLFLPLVYLSKRHQGSAAAGKAFAAVALPTLFIVLTLRFWWTPYVQAPHVPFDLDVIRHIGASFRHGWTAYPGAILVWGATPLAVLGALRPSARPFLKRYGYLAAVTLLAPFVAFLNAPREVPAPYVVPRHMIYALPFVLPLALLAIDRRWPNLGAPPPPPAGRPFWRWTAAAGHRDGARLSLRGAGPLPARAPPRSAGRAAGPHHLPREPAHRARARRRPRGRVGHRPHGLDVGALGPGRHGADALVPAPGLGPVPVAPDGRGAHGGAGGHRAPALVRWLRAGPAAHPERPRRAAAGRRRERASPRAPGPDTRPPGPRGPRPREPSLPRRQRAHAGEGERRRPPASSPPGDPAGRELTSVSARRYSASSDGRGRPKKYPWARVNPISTQASASPAVSTPSATGSAPRSFTISTSDRSSRRLERGARVDAADEADVELQQVRRRLSELDEPRLAGAEIVVGDPYASLAEGGLELDDGRHVDDGAFVDLHRELDVGSSAREVVQRLQESGLGELRRMRVHEHRRQVGPPAHDLDDLAPEEAAQLHLRPERGGGAEQLARALGEAGMAAAPQGFVTDDAAARQLHDRLEGHAHRSVSEQLLEVPGIGEQRLGRGEAP